MNEQLEVAIYTKLEVAKICVQLRDLVRDNPKARVVPVHEDNKIIGHKVEEL